MAKVYIIMGVSGSGKTTIGKELSRYLKLPFYDADDFHPRGNIEKMKRGIPLNDKDRLPWLESLNKAIGSWSEGGILACSALKESYRKVLQKDQEVSFIYLKGNYELIYQRMLDREHYMKPEMLRSQFEALEEPKEGIIVTIDKTVDDVVSEIMKALKNYQLPSLGIIGMGVMGRSLALNALSKGLKLAVYNRSSRGEEMVIPNLIKEQGPHGLMGFDQLDSFVESLEVPRKIVLMIPAGDPVDKTLASLLPLLNAGDIIMDGGNSHYQDTQKRQNLLTASGVYYLGIGISGGEKGALEGPSLMVGGNRDAYQVMRPILESLAAKAIDNQPCVGYFGENGAGHFIKTVHNGIEYGEMQLLAEVYSVLKSFFNPEEIHTLLSEWNKGELSSFLLETTLNVLGKKEDESYLLEKVLDVAEGKGTGTWTSKMALDWGVPTTLLTEAVMARSLSQMKERRVELETQLNHNSFEGTIDLNILKTAYSFARNINHLQGLQLILKGSEKEQWEVDLAEVLRVWTNGCILRSKLLEEWYERLQKKKVFWDWNSFFLELHKQETSVSQLVFEASQQRTPLPCFSSALQYWLGLTTGESSANLIQALRDAFGSHTYKRIDKINDGPFTSNWNTHG